MKKFFVLLATLLMILPACGQTTQKEQEAVYVNITAEEAKKIMDTETDYVILDVRTQEEYDQGHIPGAIVIPDTEIKVRAEEELPDKDEMILVYCRSGRRSKEASQKLSSYGYENVLEIGGILDYSGELEK